LLHKNNKNKQNKTVDQNCPICYNTCIVIKKELEMTATASIRAAVGQDMQRQREIRMYGCTEDQMREAVEQSITFRHSGPAMMAASLMSDAQEMINLDYGDIDYMRAEDARQALNRAKWILFEYCSTR
jgi:hypothetical protein